MSNKILSLLSGRLERDLLIGLTLKGGGAAASFGLSLLISHSVGASGLGIFQISLTTAALLSVAAVFGLDTVLVRAVSVAWHQGALGKARALILRILTIVARNSVLCGVGMAALSFPFTHFILQEPELFPSMLLMAAAVPLLALIRVMSAAIRGTGSVLISQSLDGIAYTGLAAAGFAVTIIGLNRPNVLSPSIAYISACALVAVAGGYCLSRIIRSWPKETAHISAMAGRQIAIIFLLGQSVEWIAIASLGGLSGPADAGIYRVAAQYCLLFGIVNNAFAQMAGPHLAAQFAKGNYREMMLAAKKASLIGGGLSLPILFAILAAPGWLLSIFGPEFERGAVALIVMALGQFINVAIGPMGTILIMSHHEKLAVRLEVFASGSAIVLLFFLLPDFGLLGAATASSVGMIIRNIGAFLLVRHLFGKRALARITSKED